MNSRVYLPCARSHSFVSVLSAPSIHRYGSPTVTPNSVSTTGTVRGS